MTPHDDRHTSLASAAPNRTQPDMTATAFPFTGQTARSSTNSLRRQDGAHHKARAIRIIRNSDKQRHLPTVGMKGSSGNSQTRDIGSSCQYVGRRRHGPTQQVFRIA